MIGAGKGPTDSGGSAPGSAVAVAVTGAGLAGGRSGPLPQATSVPTIKPLRTAHRNRFMRLLLLEALGALVLLLLIVWWTMFSGRKGGELPPAVARGNGAPDQASKPGEPPAQR